MSIESDIERASARPVRKRFTLLDAGREFWRHPTSWLIGGALVLASVARIAAGDWQITDALVVGVMVAAFPFFEWGIHVFILHWRPRRVAGVTIDPALARRHRQHHVDPRNMAFIPIPSKTLLLSIFPLTVGIAVLAFPRLGLGLTYLVVSGVLGFCYEWSHCLIHSDYKPKTAAYRAIWRDHRLHHYKNENYWFTTSTSGTADWVLRTYPDPATIRTSPTAKNLHAGLADG
jgi:sterol desaturase/sphingolipid hydroxylase (fatty acid hydroxylase superfamily)